MANIFRAKSLISRTGTFSHEVTAPNLVYNTGNQTISGEKTFAGTGIFNAVDLNNIDNLSLSGIDIDITGSTVNVYGNVLISGNPVLTGIDLSSYATVANLSTTGSTLDTKANNLSGYINSSYSNIVFTTGNQTISGVKTFNIAPILSGNNLITGVDLSQVKDFGQTININTNTINLDLNTSSYFLIPLTGNITTININNPKSIPEITSFVLQLSGDGTIRSIVWPNYFRWPGGTAPIITSTQGKIDTHTIFSYNGGIEYFAFPAGFNS
jgi:hypothetical protein